MQNDFCPGGALGIKDADTIIASVNRYIKIFSEAKLPVIVTRDWHPKKTRHFKKFGGAWPAHCVQNTKGSRFHPRLKVPKAAIIVSKGMDPGEDSYSAFQARDEQGRSLSVLLKLFGVEEVFICGLATDYCVKWTTLDALKEGIAVTVLADAIKGVDLKPDDSKKAIAEMARGGAKMSEFDSAAKMVSRG